MGHRLHNSGPAGDALQHPAAVVNLDVVLVVRQSEAGARHRELQGHSRWRSDYSPNAKANFQFDRVVKGWRNRRILDLRLKK